MKLAQLIEFGIPARFVDRWHETIGPELLDWQADAVRHFDLFGQRSLIVTAPTSSGKTFLAEMAATATLVRRRKVVYVAPLKALVMQKYERFRTVFGELPLGFRVIVSTRDRRAADARLRKGDFDVAVTVYEKWHALLLTHLDLLAAVDLVILDEPQLLGDPKRGPVVAAILDMVAAANRSRSDGKLRLLLLTAHLPQAAAIADYLGAATQVVCRRPVELRLGILNDGRFHFREHNSGETGEEMLPWDNRLPPAERPIALLQALAARGERILVFCTSKSDCHRRAAALAEQRAPDCDLDETDRWHLRSGPSLAAPLAEWLTRGVAVHHADLTPHQRALVETRFTRGQVSVNFCTGTLAWGVNLPATMAFVDAEKYTGGIYTGQVIPMPLDRLEFEGMAGRAGRLGLDRNDGIGRGVIWSHTPCEAELLWQTYIAPQNGAGVGGSETHPYRNDGDTPGTSACADDGLACAFAADRRLLDWVVAGLARSLSDAEALARRSPFRSDLPPDRWEAALQRLLDGGLAQCDPDGRLVPTPRGSLTASAGIGIDSAIAIVRALAACGDFDAAIWSAVLSALPEAADARLGVCVRAQGPMTAVIAARWHRHFGEDFTPALARRFPNAPQAVTIHFPNVAAQARAMLTALVLDDWGGGRSTHELEQAFALPVGRLEPVADTISWLLETAGALATTIPEAARFAADFARAAFETRHGLRRDAAALVEALEGLLPRQVLLDLIARGWDDPATLAQRSVADLAALMPLAVAEDVLRRARAWVQRHAAEAAGPSSPQAETIPTGESRNTIDHSANKEVSMSPILHFDGAACHARMAIHLAGRTVLLRAKSFKYLLALATARYVSRDGWIAKQEIEAGENQIKYLYQLRRELREAGGAVDGLIENDGGGHYRLTLPPQAIQFDLPRLLEHPDWDIRSRAERLAATGGATIAA